MARAAQARTIDSSVSRRRCRGLVATEKSLGFGRPGELTARRPACLLLSELGSSAD